MTHYIEYLSPERANFWFSGQSIPVQTSHGSWSKRYKPHDVIWILTRDGDQVYLVVRSEIMEEEDEEEDCDTSSLASPPRAIPVSLKTLRQLRFDSGGDRVTQSGTRIFEHHFAAVRKLKPPTQKFFEQLWEDNPTSLWNPVGDEMGSVNNFASPETRKKVEAAAVHHVTEWHEARGWSVVSREKDGVGYDLECTKQKKRRCVEVKGSSGDGRSFIMTRGERNQAEKNPDFVLAVVTSALEAPVVKFVAAQKLLAAYCFEPLSYIVALLK